MSKDARFARLQTDPRFRRPKQKQLKAEIDERFADVLNDDFGATKGRAKVDKRGRAVGSTSGADSMKRFYRLASPEAGEQRVDYARGEGALDSSGSEDEESEVEEEELEIGGKKSYRSAFIESESEEESDDEGQLRIDLSEGEDEELGAEEDEEDEEGVDPTTRIAVVNLDWDNMRAADLFAIFNSIIKSPPSKDKNAPPARAPGKLVNVRIYPSEFGKERMAKEDEAGPGGGIFAKPAKAAKKKRAEPVSEDEEDEEEEESEEGEDEEEEDSGDDAEDDDEEALEDDGLDAERDDLEIMSDMSDSVSNAGSEDIDMDQLRKYQLERLRYYYAVATFSTVEAAKLAHDELNGTEFERTANILDLSFVPEDMTFADDELHDEATKEPKGYKGNEFVTDALRHSKVKLTWDQDDPNRAKKTRRALTREEIDDEDFGDLVAASSDEASEADSESGEEAPSKDKKKSKKEKMKERKAKLRALLSADTDTADIWGKAGQSWENELADLREDREGKKSKKGKEEVEITFKPGLTLEDGENLTSLERYQRRMKEKKARKKEKIELKRAGKESDGEEGEKADDFFGDESDSEPAESEPETKGKSKGKKGDKRSKKRDEEEEKNEVTFDADAAGLVEDPSSHFSLKDMMQAEKEAGKKRKRKHKKSKKEPELGPDGFSVDVADPRFAAVFQEPAFALDPTHPKFTDVSANREILKRTREGRQKAAEADKGEKDLGSLVESVKSKMGSRPRKRSRT